MIVSAPRVAFTGVASAKAGRDDRQQAGNLIASQPVRQCGRHRSHTGRLARIARLHFDCRAPTVTPPCLPVRRRLAIPCLLLAWLCANGAVWDALQVVAWTRMFANNTQTMTMSAAWRETFDGSKPCEMCLGVAKAKETAQKQLPPPGERTEIKFVLAIESVDVPVFVNLPGRWTRVAAVTHPERTDPVPVPPPRV